MDWQFITATFTTLGTVFGVVVGWFAKAIAPLIVEPLQLWIAHRLASSKRQWAFRSRLAGTWHHIWYAKESSSWPDVNECTVRLNGIGRFAAGLYNYRGKTWLITARIGDDQIVAGTWRDVNTGGYAGTWLGKQDLNRETIAGWYLGTSNRGPATVGEWIFWRDGCSPPSLPLPLVQPAPREYIGNLTDRDAL